MTYCQNTVFTLHINCKNDLIKILIFEKNGFGQREPELNPCDILFCGSGSIEGLILIIYITNNFRAVASGELGGAGYLMEGGEG